VNFITCGGTLDSTMLESHLLLALDDEVCGMMLRMAEGIAVTDDTIAMDVIRQVNFAGNYLVEQHTRRRFRQEHYIPQLLVREGYQAWEKEGSKTVLDRARERVREILDAHQPRELDPAMEKELNQYLEKTRARSIEDYMVYEDDSRQDFSAL
jgi:trimethylamine--corrinoid protein Co-methyltransferase